VDAAYGGFFVLTDRAGGALPRIERADSITLDPHKGLFLPYGTGSVLVPRRGALRRAHSVHAEYLPPVPEDPEFVDYSSVSPELSRDFRGLRVWLPIKMHGIGPSGARWRRSWTSRPGPRTSCERSPASRSWPSPSSPSWPSAS
jgi:aromatic-L-amino-acid decarboxylase